MKIGCSDQMTMMMMILTLVQLQEAKQTGPDPDKFSSTQILNPPKKVKLGIHLFNNFVLWHYKTLVKL